MFTKGQTGFLIQSWDNRGTYTIREARVHSCGKKRMVLESLDGSECFGREFQPGQAQYHSGLFITGVTREQAEAVALDTATKYRIKAAKQYAGLAEVNTAKQGYAQAIYKSLSEVVNTTPGFIWK